MNIKFSISVGTKSGRWGSIENVAFKEFEIDIPDELPLMHFGEMVNTVFAAVMEEHKKIAAEAAKE